MALSTEHGSLSEDSRTQARLDRLEARLLVARERIEELLRAMEEECGGCDKVSK